jgi:DNA-binding LacI/PurR family transcriptional regulator
MLGLARHLTGLGHRRVGVICMRLAAQRNDGPVSAARQATIGYPVQRNRLAGLRDGLAEVGVDWSGVPVWERFDHSVEAGQSAAAELLAAHPN